MREVDAIQRLREGDITGMEFLVRTYQTEALRAANLITRDRTLAEDVVQDGFIQAWDRIDTFDPDRPFEPWFRRCVVNLALKAVKRQGRHVSLYDDSNSTNGMLIDTDPDPGEFLELVEQAGSVRSALNELSPDQRAAIVLHYYGGLSDRESAERLGRPIGTIKWWLHSARQRLRRILSPENPTAHPSLKSDETREDRS